jgi:tetratricopeptide (TPR) repeat protein
MTRENEYTESYEQGWAFLREILRARSASSEPHIAEQVCAQNAMVLFRRCIEIEASSWPSMWGLGKAHQALGEHVESLKWMERALEKAPAQPDVLREASIEAMAVGEPEKAERYGRRALDVLPLNAGLWANCALALLMLRRGEEAKAAAEKACAIAPGDAISRNVFAKVNRVIAGEEGWPSKMR